MACFQEDVLPKLWLVADINLPGKSSLWASHIFPDFFIFLVVMGQKFISEGRKISLFCILYYNLDHILRVRKLSISNVLNQSQPPAFCNFDFSSNLSNQEIEVCPQHYSVTCFSLSITS